MSLTQMVISFFPYPDYINAKLDINIYILCPDTRHSVWQPTARLPILQTDPPRNHLNEKIRRNSLVLRKELLPLQQRSRAEVACQPHKLEVAGSNPAPATAAFYGLKACRVPEGQYPSALSFFTEPLPSPHLPDSACVSVQSSLYDTQVLTYFRSLPASPSRLPPHGARNFITGTHLRVRHYWPQAASVSSSTRRDRDEYPRRKHIKR